MNMRNPLATARGLGSAKEGVHHWYAQRASALMLIVLVGWLVFAMIRLSDADHAAASAFIAQPVNAAFLILLLVTLLYHAMLGLQVVIEDYVHHAVLEVVMHFLTRAGAFFGMALGIIHVLKLALGA
ncbi:MAG: succinate dehydrogenase, hydrophobic membrane anchor protein [Xanthomonadales bacterium]|nr:succinate dehydrogenase, hydrophobic membrane anchor protein [Gammaproteobacteria bacterium]MBT8052777.1 succinate dehydrogenase, hydrophobic membrane anchor protein [Gammaproteobacteria bacterium]NND56160.1 succinate dehydrogenase, hydrophobic membrane anchor protein [Xanthomonadales bacterium]NNK50565.1 succinate dehydrogenase, hydrophobic membrane anchor protein [Xanthomonadales bacterium]